jgi:hypothetical protein
MEELLDDLYNDAGGDGVYGNIDNFRKIPNQDPKLHKEIYNDLGGDQVFGGIDKYNAIFKVGQTSVAQTQAKPQIEIDVEDTRNWFQQFGDYLGGITTQAIESGKRAELLEVTDVGYNLSGKGVEDLSKGELIQITDSLKRSQDAAKKTEGFEGIFSGDTFLNKTEKYLGLVTEAVYTSLASQVTAAFQEGDALKATAASAGVGAAIGASGFLTGPGGFATTATGAITGVKVGLGASFIEAGADLEFSNIILDRAQKYAQENGLDYTDPDQLAEIFNSEEWRSGALKDASIGTAIVAGADILTAGVASKIGGARAAKAIAKRTDDAVGLTVSDYAKTKLVESAIEGVGGATGELGKQLAIEDSINVQEVVLEAAAGSVTGVVETAAFAPVKDRQVRIAEEKKRTEILKQSRLQDLMVNSAVQGTTKEEFSEGVDLGVTGGGITQEQGVKLKAQQQAVADASANMALGNEVGKGAQALSLHARLERASLESRLAQEEEKFAMADESVRPEIQERIDGLRQQIETKTSFIQQIRKENTATVQDVNDTRKLQRGATIATGIEIPIEAISVRAGEVTIDKAYADNNPDVLETIKKEIESTDGLTYVSGETAVSQQVQATDTQSDTTLGPEVTPQVRAPAIELPQVQATDTQSDTTLGPEVTPQEQGGAVNEQTPDTNEAVPQGGPAIELPQVRTPEEITAQVQEEIGQDQDRLQQVEQELSALFEEFQSNSRIGELQDSNGGLLRVLDADQDVSTQKGRATAFKNMGQVSQDQISIFGEDKVNRAKQLAAEYQNLNKNLTPQARQERVQRRVNEERAIPQAPQEVVSEARQAVRAANDVAKARYKAGPKTLQTQVDSVIDAASEAGITVEVLSDKDFTERRGKSARGSYIPSERTVLINKDKAGKNTLAHELAHALIIDELGVNSERVTEIGEALRGALQQGDAYERSLIGQIDRVISDYKNTGATDVRNHEFLAELASILKENKARIQKRRSLSKRIIDSINDIIVRFTGKKPLAGVKDINQAIDWINGLADRLEQNNLTVENRVDQVVRENFDSLNRDTETRNRFIRDLQSQFPELTPNELLQVLNREGVSMDAQTLAEILQETSAEVNLVQSTFGQSVINDTLSAILEQFGEGLPGRGTLTLEQATQVASDKGYITQDFGAEMRIAEVAMQGGGVDSLQSLALGHALARLSRLVATDQALVNGMDHTNAEVEKRLSDNLKMFRAMSIAYAKVGSQQGRGLVYRRLLKYNDTSSDILASERWIAKFGTKVPPAGLKEYRALVAELEKEGIKFNNLMQDQAKRSEEITRQRADETVKEVKKSRNKPSGAKKDLISRLRDSLGLDKETVFDSTDPEGERRKLVEIYRNIYDLAKHLIVNENITSLPELTAEIKRVAPTLEDNQILEAFALANRRVNEPKKNTEYKLKMDRIRQEIKLVQSLEKQIASLRGNPRLNLKQIEHFSRVIADLQDIMLRDLDQDSTTAERTRQIVETLNRTIAMFSEGQKLKDEGLLGRAFDLIQNNVLLQDAAHIKELENRLALLKQDSTQEIVDGKLTGVQTALDVEIERQRDVIEDARNRLKLKEHELAFEADLDARFPLPEQAGARRLYIQARRGLIKAYAGTKDGFYEATRTLLFSFDASMIMMQGGFLLSSDIGKSTLDLVRGKPKQAAMNLAKYKDFLFQSLKAAWNDAVDANGQESLSMYYAVLASDAALLAKEYGVNFSKPGDISRTEEFFRSRVLQKAPLGIGRGIKFSENFFVTYMNMIRAESFRQMYQSAGHNMNADQLRKAAEFVNDMTGKSSPNSSFSLAISQASKVLSAPSLFISQYRMALLNLPRALRDFGKSKGEDPNSKLVIKQYIKYAVGQAALTAAVMALTGAELEEDPKDSNFGKLRLDDNVIDLNHGLSGFTKLGLLAPKLAYRGETGENLFGEPDVVEEKGERMKTFASSAMNILKYKLHPTIQLSFNIFDQANAIGQPYGRTTTERYYRLLATSFLPIPLHDVSTGNNKLIDRKIEKLDETYQEFLEPLDKPEEESFIDNMGQTLVQALGTGFIDYENKLKHTDVDKYLRAIEWTNTSGETKKGVDANTTATQARKYIPSLDESEALRQSANGKGIIDGYKKDCDDFLGQWILDKLNEGEEPSKAQIKTKTDQIQARIGKIYEQTYFSKEED